MFSDSKILSDQTDNKRKNCDFFVHPDNTFSFEIDLYTKCKELDSVPSFDCINNNSGNICIRLYDDNKKLLYIKVLTLKKFRNFSDPNGYKVIVAEYCRKEKDDEFLKVLVCKNRKQGCLNIENMQYIADMMKYESMGNESVRYIKILCATVDI